jgi:preprotein translocase subunit SecA
MLGFVSKAINSLFGNKSDRDIKLLVPRVAEINAQFELLKALSHDQLRAKTSSLRERVSTGLAALEQEIAALKTQAEKVSSIEVDQKFEIYEQIDKLVKQKDVVLEELLDALLPEAFAVVKETARRFTENDELTVTATELDRDLAATKDFVRIEGDKAIYKNRWQAAGTEVVWNMVHYDVQLIGGMVLHNGKIAEMATGEGKTLVSTLPAYLNALSGQGVHLVTVNDYLAKRDSEWNGPIFQFHGITVDCIDRHQPNSPARRKAYQADITYGTNNEFGFDYLRDNMAHTPGELVQRKHHFAMVDEVDSVLIDDARTPLIISGPVPRGDIHEFQELKPRIERLVEAQKRFVNTALIDAKRLIAAGKNEEGGLALYRAYRGLPKSKALIKFLSESGMRAQLPRKPTKGNAQGRRAAFLYHRRKKQHHRAHRKRYRAHHCFGRRHQLFHHARCGGRGG